MAAPEKGEFQQEMDMSSPLGKDKLKLLSMHGSEALGRLFQFEVQAYSEGGSAVAAKDILGKKVTLRVMGFDKNNRYFNGIVSRFSLVGVDKTKPKILYVYRLTLVPELWLLTRRANCRIFQHKNVPDILREVLKGLDLSFELQGSFREWEYCVQYRETDFNFASRLMENEGIYYYFKHEDGKHTLHLCNSATAHKKTSKYENLEFRAPGPHLTDDRIVWDWVHGHELLSESYKLMDFNPMTSQTDLKQSASVQNLEGTGQNRLYDYPGGYTKPGEGHDYIRVRTEEIEAQYTVAHALTSARGVCPGFVFTLNNHPVVDNVDYLITGATYQLTNDDQGTGLASGERGADFSAQITVMPCKIPYRSPRITPKPVIQGPQTAYVVGESGEEITVDKYARIKVQFHWDEEGKKNQDSSCWIRVAQIWAAKQWGFQFIPRHGMEVIVTFLEGDPDRPLVTGCVYNDVNMPTFQLPSNKTQSGVKTRSTLQGTPDNFNEIRFEDKKGHEQLFIHAEKNQDIEVENNETHWVGNNRQKKIDHDETTHVKHDRTETVDNNETISIGKNRTEVVGMNESITIAVARTEVVGAAESVTIGAARVVEIGAMDSLTIGAARVTAIGGADTLTVGGTRETTVGNHEVLTVGKDLSIVAGESITITTGEASITMKKNGNIIIKGKDITIDGSGKMDFKAGQKVTVKGSSIDMN